MSVMENLRSGTDSTFMQVILFLVVVSFVFWYAAPQGEMATVLATVNGEPILDTEFGPKYRQAEARQGRALGDDAQAKLREQVKQQMIQEEVILQEAARLGLQVSEREIARQLLNVPYFQEDGKFSQKAYQKFLKGQRLTQSGYEDGIRRELLRNKLQRLIYQGASISEPVLREAYIEQQTQVNLSYVRVRPPVFYDFIEPTQEELDAYLLDHADLIEKRYKQDLSREYDIPTTVHLRVLRLQKLDDGEDELARIEALRAEAIAGADFDDLVRRYSEDPLADKGGDMGTLPLTDLAPEVRGVMKDEEGNDLATGAVSRPVQTANDVRIFKVESTEAGRVIPLDEVRTDIATRLIAEEKAPTVAVDFATQMIAKWSETSIPPEADFTAKRLRVDETGPVALAGARGAFAPPEQMMSWAADAEVGQVMDTPVEKDGVYWIGQLVDRVPADMDLYEDERDQIREQVLNERRFAFYEAWIADAKKRAVIQ